MGHVFLPGTRHLHSTAAAGPTHDLFLMISAGFLGNSLPAPVYYQWNYFWAIPALDRREILLSPIICTRLATWRRCSDVSLPDAAKNINRHLEPAR